MSPTYTAYPSTYPSIAPLSSSSDTLYSFQCIQDSADPSACPSNCGVCGNQYYVPFVFFTVITAGVLALTLFLVFVEMFCFLILPTPSPIVWEPQSAIDIIVHGSKAFGFPIVTRLDLTDALTMERYLMDKQVRSALMG
jgi:hypothetical protein